MFRRRLRRGEMVGCDGDSVGVRLGSQWCQTGLSTCDIVMGMMVCSPGLYTTKH